MKRRSINGSGWCASHQISPAPLASSSNSQVRFAWFTCQDWSVNHWQAMSLLAQENLDFVVHVGDYIYETVGASFQAGGAEPAHGTINPSMKNSLRKKLRGACV